MSKYFRLTLPLLLLLLISLISCSENLNEEGEKTVRSPEEVITEVNSFVNKSEEITQPSGKEIKDFTMNAHYRDPNQLLYPIKPDEHLMSCSAQFSDLSTVSHKKIFEALSVKFPDEADCSGNGCLYLGDDGSTAEFSNYGFGFDRGDYVRNYIATIDMFNMGGLNQRRDMTASQTEELSFMRRAEALEKAEEFFSLFNLNDLILRGFYTVHEPVTGESFYYLKFMQNIQGIPLADDFGIPYFIEQDTTGISSKLKVIIDKHGISQVEISTPVQVEASNNPVDIIDIKAFKEEVESQISDIINPVSQYSIDSLELVWGSDRGIGNAGQGYSESFDLVPYYLVVTRESITNQEDPLSEGDNFRQWVFDARTGQRR